MRLIAAILLSLFYATAAHAWSHGVAPITGASLPAGQYFVAQNGNDFDTGASLAHPWKTIGKVLANSYAAGSTISFNGGDSFIGDIVINSTLTPGPFTVNSYGAGQAHILSGNSQPCVEDNAVPNVTINNLDCRGAGDGNAGRDSGAYGILINGTSQQPPSPIFVFPVWSSLHILGVTISNNTISGYGWYAVISQGADGETVTNNVIHDNTGRTTPFPFDNASCLSVGGDNFTVTNNTVYNCTGHVVSSCVTGCPGASGLGIFVDGTGGLVSHNLVHDNGSLNRNCSGPVGIAPNTTNVTISFNEVYNQSGGGGCDGEGIDMNTASGNIVEYNYVHDNAAEDLAADLGSNNIFRFNIIETNGEQGVQLLQETGDQFYNNTFYLKNSGICFQTIIGGATTATLFANNICYAANNTVSFVEIDSTTVAAGSLTIKGNDYFGGGSWVWGANTYTTLANFQTGCGANCNPAGTIADPKLTSPGNGGICGGYTGTCPAAYKVMGGSPMIGAGLDLVANYGVSSVGNQDFYGNFVSSNTLPIGAHNGN